MEESIYNIVQEEQPKPEKLPRYKSSFPGKLPPTCSTFTHHQTSKANVSNVGGHMYTVDRCHSYYKVQGNLGRPTKSVTNPADYLKTRTKPVATLKQVQALNPDRLKPSATKQKIKPNLPAKGEEPICNLVTEKNFIVANAVENILAAPKKKIEEDDDFMNKEDFGKIPAYLNKIKKDIEAEYAYIRNMKEAEMESERQSTRPLASEERQAILQGLKAKWEEINSEYQLGTHLTKLDTVGKIIRKEQHESKLTQIENDIEKFKRSNIHIDPNL